jgi:hypothetical protein
MVGQINWLFIDIDHTSIDKIQSRINEFDRDYGLYPTMIVDSGKGNQMYWELSDVWNSAEWKAIQSVIRNYFDADHMVKRAGYYMRVTGTENRKYLLGKYRKKGYTDVYHCGIIEKNDRIYTKSSFAGLMSNILQVKTTPPTKNILNFGVNLKGKAGLNKIR